jgi:hypothetical protein
MTYKTIINAPINILDLTTVPYMDKYIIGFDIETNPDGSICYLMLGTEDTCYIYLYNYVDFFFDMIRKLQQTSFNFIIFAHNGGKFDFLYILEYLDKHFKYCVAPNNLDEYSLLNVNGSVIQIKISINIELRDSLRLFSGSLDSLTKSFSSVRKLTGTYDYNIYRDVNYKSNWYNIEKDIPYITTDIFALVEAIKNFNSLTFCNPDLNDLHTVPLTAGSGAYRMLLDDTYKSDNIIYKSAIGYDDNNTYMQNKRKNKWLYSFLGKETPEQEKLERKGYVGGYVSAKVIGQSLYVRIGDISSAYPHKLAEGLLPIGETKNIKLDCGVFDNMTAVIDYCNTLSKPQRPPMGRGKWPLTLGMTMRFKILCNLKPGYFPILSAGAIGFGQSRTITWIHSSKGEEEFTCSWANLQSIDTRYSVYSVEPLEVNLYWMLPRLYKPMKKYYKYKDDMKALDNQGAYNASKIVINSPTGKFGERDHYAMYNPVWLDEKIEVVNSWQKNKNNEYELMPCYAMGEYETYLKFKHETKLWFASRFDDNFSKIIKSVNSQRKRGHTSVKTISNITGLTREQLQEAANNFEHGADDVIYTDTDSLFVLMSDKNNEAMDKMNNTELGGWEFGDPCMVFIFGLKQYLIEAPNGVKCKWIGISEKNKCELIARYTDFELITDSKGVIMKEDKTPLKFDEIRLDEMFMDYSNGVIEIVIDRMKKTSSGMIMESRQAKINAKSEAYDRRLW